MKFILCEWYKSWNWLFIEIIWVLSSINDGFMLSMSSWHNKIGSIFACRFHLIGIHCFMFTGSPAKWGYMQYLLNCVHDEQRFIWKKVANRIEFWAVKTTHHWPFWCACIQQPILIQLTIPKSQSFILFIFGILMCEWYVRLQNLHSYSCNWYIWNAIIIW